METYSKHMTQPHLIFFLLHYIFNEFFTHVRPIRPGSGNDVCNKGISFTNVTESNSSSHLVGTICHKQSELHQLQKDNP